ncbi:MAG: hypothetical protein KKI08_11865 [Armatimonadetes bacterium]|nr:hypothetical protein [Armatimonadota bacterium]
MTDKQRAFELVSRMPDDATLEDIQYHLYVLAAIERGEKDIADGKVLSHAEVERRLSAWLR